jgi:hypothetical protein
MLCFIKEDLNTQIPGIDEDIILLIVKNYYLSESLQNLLKEAFINSGILKADKKIIGYFLINERNKSSITSDNFVEREDSLQNYAINRYDIYLK